MSNDLISRSALSKKICNKECDVPKFETEVEVNAFLLGLNTKQIAVMECLSNMPAAYDVERVEKESQNIELIYPTDQGYDYEDAIGIDVNKAVEIVKSGGIK